MSDVSTTTAPPASHAPAPTTTAAQQSSSPSPATTQAPGNTTSAPPANQTTAAPGTTTTAAPGAPTVEGKIEIDPADASQDPTSVQVPESATLTLTWSSTNAASVNIDGLGSGLAASGSSAVPTQDSTFTLVAVAADGTQSAPVTVSVATHPDGDVVSGHSDLGSGIAAILSFGVMKDGQLVTSVAMGDTVTLSAIVSAATDSVTLGGAAASLAPADGGNQQATASVTIAAPMSGDFDCEASAAGVAATPASCHVEIEAASSTPSTTTRAPTTTTTAAPTTTTAAPTTTTRAPTTTTTAAPTTTTTAAPSTTTTAPSTTTTAPATTTSQAPTTTTQPGTTTTAGAVPTITRFVAVSTDNPDGTQDISCTPGTVVTLQWEVSNDATQVTFDGPVGGGSFTSQFSGKQDFTVPAQTDAGGGSSANSGTVSFTLAASNSAGAAPTQTVYVRSKAQTTVEFTAEYPIAYPLYTPPPLRYAKVSLKPSIVPAVKLTWVANGDPPPVNKDDLFTQFTNTVKGLADVVSWSTITDAQLVNDGSQLSPTANPLGGKDGSESADKGAKLSVDAKWKLQPSGIGLQVSCIIASIAKDQKSGDWSTKACTLEGEASKDVPLASVPIGDGTWTASGVVSLKLDLDAEPDWGNIALDAVKLLGADALIVVSMVAGGIATIAVACIEIWEGWALEDLAKQLDASEKSAVAGYMTALGVNTADDGGDSGAYSQGQQSGASTQQSVIDNQCGGDASKFSDWMTQNADAVKSQAHTNFRSSARTAAFQGFAKNHGSGDLKTLQQGWLVTMGSPAPAHGGNMDLWRQYRGAEPTGMLSTDIDHTRWLGDW